jgi:hypothetical protein
VKGVEVHVKKTTEKRRWRGAGVVYKTVGETEVKQKMIKLESECPYIAIERTVRAIEDRHASGRSRLT